MIEQISGTTHAPTPGALETACAQECPNAAGDGQSPASPADTPTEEDRRFAAKLLALQALAYQRILLDKGLREYKERVYRKFAEIDEAIADLSRGMKMPIVGEDFIIKARRNTAIANTEHLTPSQRRKARMRTAYATDLVA